MTPKSLAELEDLHRHATQGPWLAADQSHGNWVGIQDQWMALGTMADQDDALLVIEMRNHLGELLAIARQVIHPETVERVPREGDTPDYRTLAVVNALTSLGIAMEQWQVDALDRMMLASGDEDERPGGNA